MVLFIAMTLFPLVISKRTPTSQGFKPTNRSTGKSTANSQTGREFPLQSHGHQRRAA